MYAGDNLCLDLELTYGHFLERQVKSPVTGDLTGIPETGH